MVVFSKIAIPTIGDENGAQFGHDILHQTWGRCYRVALDMDLGEFPSILTFILNYLRNPRRRKCSLWKLDIQFSEEHGLYHISRRRTGRMNFSAIRELFGCLHVYRCTGEHIPHRIGADANEAVAVALRVLMADLGAPGATRQIEAQTKCAPRMETSLPGEKMQAWTRRTGIAAMSNNTVPDTSDHAFEKVDREVVRDLWAKAFKPDVRATRHAYMGASAWELRRFFKNRNAQFYFHDTEGKDPARIAIPILEDVAAYFAQAAEVDDNVSIDGLNTSKRKATVRLRELKDVLRAYESTQKVEHQRLFVDRKDIQATTLIYQDSAYNMTESAWFDDFDSTGASEAYVLGFYPDELLFKKKTKAATYNYEEIVPEDWSDHMKVLSILPAMGAYAALVNLNLPVFWTLVKMIGAMWKVAEALKGTEGYSEEAIRLVGCMEAARFYGRHDVNIPGCGSAYKGALEFAAIAATRICREWLTVRSRVTWRSDYGAFSNGYDHPKETWSLLMRKPVLTSAFRNYSLVVEIVQRVGTHMLIRIQRAKSPERIVRSIGMPKQERCIEYLDIFASYDIPSRRWKKPVYRLARYNEWWDTVNYLGGLDAKSVTTVVVRNMINRASKGLSIGSTEYSVKWTLPQDEFLAFAFAAFCQATKERADVETLLKDVKEDVNSVEKKWQELAKTAGKLLLNFATLGTAYYLNEIYWWLTQGHFVYEFHRPAPYEVTQSFDPHALRSPLHMMKDCGKYLWRLMRESVFGPADSGVEVDLASIVKGYQTASLNFQLDFNGGKTREPICECEFIKAFGDLGQQRIFCLHDVGEDVKEVEVVYTAEDMSNVRAWMAQQKVSQQNDTLANLIDRCIDMLPMQGFTWRGSIELLIGGPGVGKSYSMRKYITHLERDLGRNTMVYAPFRKLAPDYPTVVPAGEHPFKFFTTHNAWAQRGINTVVQDEYTAMPEHMGLIGAYLMGASNIILLGDEKQTGVMPEEGQRYFAQGSKLRFHDCRKHLLGVNFRNSQYMVAVCNASFGYTMYANSDIVGKPLLKPMSELANFTGPVMTFTQDTAIEIGQTPEDANTVRKNQGGTMDHVGLVLRDRDYSLVDNQALVIVALTRARDTGSLTIFADETCPSWTKMRMWLKFDDDEFQRNITSIARPNLDELYSKPAVEKYEGELNRLCNDLLSDGLIELEQNPQDYIDQQMASAKKAFVDYKKAAEALVHRVEALPSCPICGVVCPEGFTETQSLAVEQIARDMRLQAFGLERGLDGEEDEAEELISYVIRRSEGVCNSCAIRGVIDDSQPLEGTTQQEAVDALMTLEERMDFTSPSHGYMWCTASACVSPIIEDEKSLRKRLGLRRNQVLPLDEARVVNVVPVEILIMYKEYVLAHCGENTGVPRGVPLSTLATYLKSNSIGFILEEVDESGEIVNVLTWMPEQVVVDDITLLPPMAFIRGVNYQGGGHAQAMPYSSVVAYMGEQVFSIVLAGGTEKTVVSGPGYMTVRELCQGNSAVTMRDGTRKVDSDCRLANVPVGMRSKFNFIRSGLFGGWPVAGSNMVFKRLSKESGRFEGQARTVFELQGRAAIHQDYGVAFEADPEDMMVRERPLGRDDYLLAPLIDQTIGAEGRMNEVGVALGPSKQLKRGLKFNPLRLISPTNRRGHPENTRMIARSIGSGYGMWQTNAPMETLGSVQRYAARREAPRQTVEGIRHAVSVAQRNFRMNYDVQRLRSDPHLEAGMQDDFIRAAESRNYDGRVNAEHLAASDENAVMYSTKAQFKPFKSHKVPDLTKVGQGIAGACSSINMRYGPMFRILNARMKLAARPHNIYDCFELPLNLQRRLASEVSKLTMPRTGTGDVVEFDANHNWHSKKVAETHWALLCANNSLLGEYFEQVRTNYRLTAPELLSVIVEDAKGSGKPDTLCENSYIAEAYNNEVMTGKGDYCYVKKGDDYLRYQFGLCVDEERKKALYRYTNMRIDVVFDEAEFCGKVVSATGMYENVIRKFRKAVAKRSRDIGQWEEYQISIRDALQQIRNAGEASTVAASAGASHVSLETAWLAYSCLQSFAHINREQWESITYPNTHYKPGQRGAGGVLQPW